MKENPFPVKIFEHGEEVVVRTDIDVRMYRRSRPRFSENMDKYIGQKGVVYCTGGVGDSVVSVIFEGGATYEFSNEWLEHVNKRIPDQPFVNGEILVAEDEEAQFKGVLILDEYIGDMRGLILRYLIMSSRIKDMNYIHIENKLGEGMSIRKAAKEDIVSLEKDILNHPLADVYMNNFRHYIEKALEKLNEKKEA